jgi:hypothetical protein
MGEAIESKTSSEGFGIRPLFSACAKGAESGVKRRRFGTLFTRMYTFSEDVVEYSSAASLAN